MTGSPQSRGRPDRYWTLPGCSAEDALAAREEACEFPVVEHRGVRWQVLGSRSDKPSGTVSLVEIITDEQHNFAYGWRYVEVAEAELEFLCHAWHGPKKRVARLDVNASAPALSSVK